MKLVKKLVAFLKKPTTIFFGLLLVLLIVSKYNYYTSPMQNLPEAYQGLPVSSKEYEQYDIGVRQVVEVGDYIYLLFQANGGIVSVYDLNGTYQHTLFFYSYDNGECYLATDGNNLYVRDERNNVYILTDGEFNDYLVEGAAKQQQLDTLDFRSKSSSDGYIIREDGIWKITEAGEICIIKARKTE